MTYGIVWEPPAIDVASRYLTDDSEGLRVLFDAIDSLADDPRPAASFPFGSPDLRRLRIGRYRVLYEVLDADELIVVTHVGRSG